MGRDRNLVATKQLTISTTHQVVEHLGLLAKSGFWGKNAAEAAERILAEQISRLIQEGRFDRRTRKK